MSEFGLRNLMEWSHSSYNEGTRVLPGFHIVNLQVLLMTVDDNYV